MHADPRRGLRPPATLADRKKLRQLELNAGAPKRKKLRQLELKAGAPKRTKAAAGISSVNRAMREAERQLAERAEVSYKRLVQGQQAGALARKVGASETPERT